MKKEKEKHKRFQYIMSSISVDKSNLNDVFNLSEQQKIIVVLIFFINQRNHFQMVRIKRSERSLQKMKT